MINFRPPYLNLRRCELRWIHIGGLSGGFITSDISDPTIKPVFVLCFYTAGMLDYYKIATDGEQWAEVGPSLEVSDPGPNFPCIRQSDIKRLLENYTKLYPNGIRDKI